MVKYIIKRLIQSVITIALVVCVVFTLLRLMPSDYFFTEDELMKFTESQKYAKLERLGLMHLDNADPYDGFISIEEYASDLSAIDGYDITEEELMQELACAGLIVAVDYCEEFKPDGIPLEFIDKGMMKQNGDTYYISSRGRCEYEDWKRRGGVNYYKK